MEVMTQMALQFGLVPGLFVWLLFTNQKEHKIEREKSQEREIQLMNSLSKSDRILQDFAKSLEKIGETLDNMDRSMSYLQRDVEDLKAR